MCDALLMQVDHGAADLPGQRKRLRVVQSSIPMMSGFSKFRNSDLWLIACGQGKNMLFVLELLRLHHPPPITQTKNLCQEMQALKQADTNSPSEKHEG